MHGQQLILFTDLDGTLLDHHSYSWQAASPALQQLRKLRIPLVLCTSKTAAEVSLLHRQLELDTPYIIENGAGIILTPTGISAHFFGKPYSELIPLLQDLRHKYGYRFTGFNDFSNAEIAAETGLDPENARLARERLCSEPIRWQDSQQALLDFQQHLSQYDLQLLRGGRFYHVLGKAADKGVALHWLLANYPDHNGSNWYSIALGDGPNDQSMLDAADLAVVIPSESGVSPEPKNSQIIYAEEPGPSGWNHAVLGILAKKGVN